MPVKTTSGKTSCFGIHAALPDPAPNHDGCGECHRLPWPVPPPFSAENTHNKHRLDIGETRKNLILGHLPVQKKNAYAPK